MNSSTVILMAQDSLTRLGLRASLAGSSTRLLGEAAGPLDLVAKTAGLQPDIIVLSLRSSAAQDLVLIRETAAAASAARIIVIAGSLEEQFLDQALVYGASAYLLPETAAEDLKWAIKAVRRGREYFSPALIECLRRPCALPEPDQHQPLLEPINPVQARLNRLIRQGLLIRYLVKELSAGMDWMGSQPELARSVRLLRKQLESACRLARSLG